MYQSPARQADRRKAEDVEAEKRDARPVRRRLGHKGARESTDEADVPQKERAAAMTGKRQIARDRIFLTHDGRQREDDRDEQRKLQEVLRHALNAVGDRVIDVADEDGAGSTSSRTRR